jgi:hypothetical protein
MVATALLATAVVGLAQLFVVASANNLAARHTTYATILAAQKLEELSALNWADLALSPEAALREDTPGWVDYLDQFGGPLPDPRARGNAAHAPFVYARRWTIQPLRANPGQALIVQVVVTRQRDRDVRQAVVGRRPEEARLVTVRTRKAP